MNNMFQDQGENETMWKTHQIKQLHLHQVLGGEQKKEQRASQATRVESQLEFIRSSQNKKSPTSIIPPSALLLRNTDCLASPPPNQKQFGSRGRPRPTTSHRCGIPTTVWAWITFPCRLNFFVFATSLYRCRSLGVRAAVSTGNDAQPLGLCARESIVVFDFGITKTHFKIH